MLSNDIYYVYYYNYTRKNQPSFVSKREDLFQPKLIQFVPITHQYISAPFKLSTIR